MLRRLTVANYALIDSLQMELDPSLNIITGETGAGKSILLGALGLIIGNKSDGAAIKDNSQNCVIEGEFHISNYNLKDLFEEYDWEWEECITLRRVITPSGKSRAFVGDMPAQLSELKVLGSRLIDIHSQHQNRKLSDESYRLTVLDSVAACEELLGEYQVSYRHLLETKRALSQAQQQSQALAREQEWLGFQIEEFDALKLREGEREEIESELRILENGDKISEAFALLSGAIDDELHGALITLKSSQLQMAAITDSYPPAEEYNQRLCSVIEELKDMSRSADRDSERVVIDSDKLSKLTSRLDAILSLEQKHRANSYEQLLATERDIREKWSIIENSDALLEELTQSVRIAETAARKLSDKLHSARAKAATALSKSVESIIVKLGLSDAKFIVEVNGEGALGEMGGDSVEYLFSANSGKSPQSVDKIASGGEISRIMLAIKATLAKSTKLPTIIFDEIDTGVSGRIASAMGDIIAELSKDMQVVDITHLPQVAAKGDSHFVVYKESSRTNITKLSTSQRVEHIASMLSADAVTEAAVSQARNLLSSK